MIIVSVDYGLKRTGIAICDRNETICSPLEVLTVTGELLLRKIASIVDEYRADAILLGLPYNMDGTEGPQAKKVRVFGDQLAKLTGIEILYQDERLSSEYASEMLRPAELTRKKKKQRLDAVAAAAILQAFIETRKSNNFDFNNND